jgi:hypothetical protein
MGGLHFYLYHIYYGVREAYLKPRYCTILAEYLETKRERLKKFDSEPEQIVIIKNTKQGKKVVP